MPQIYSAPVKFTAGVGTENMSDGNKSTFYETSATSFTLDFEGTQTHQIDSVYVLAEGIDSISFTASPGGQGLGSSVAGGLTFGNRRGVVSSTPPSVGATGATLRIARSASTAKIYQVLVMRHLLDLTDTDTRAITRFETTGSTRSSYIQEDLYGTRTVQVGRYSDIRRSINYQIWESAANLTAARHKISQLLYIQQENPNIVIWDLDEANAQDYESVFAAFWVPGSFSSSIEGAQAVSYSFGVEEQ